MMYDIKIRANIYLSSSKCQRLHSARVIGFLLRAYIGYWRWKAGCYLVSSHAGATRMMGIGHAV